MRRSVKGGESLWLFEKSKEQIVEVGKGGEKTPVEHAPSCSSLSTRVAVCCMRIAIIGLTSLESSKKQTSGSHYESVSRLCLLR